MIVPIRDEETLHQSLERIEQLWGAEIGTREGDELDILMTLVEVYENKHYPMPPSDPIEAIKFRMDQLGMDRKDLEQYIGPKSRVSDVLSKKRPLTMSQIIKLHKGMSIPYECLIDESLVA